MNKMENSINTLLTLSKIAGYPSQEILVNLISADTNTSIKDYPTAIENYYQLLDKVDKSVKPYVQMLIGGLKYAIGDYKRALEIMNEAIKLNPGIEGDAYYLRAITKMELGDTQGTKEDYLKAKELDKKIHNDKLEAL